MSAKSDEVIRLWRTEGKDRLLTEIRRSSFPDEDSFRQAIEFHEERGCEREFRKKPEHSGETEKRTVCGSGFGR